MRDNCGIATAEQLEVPTVAHKNMLVMVHRFTGEERFQATILNFSANSTTGTVHSEWFPARATVDTSSGRSIAEVDDLNRFSVSLDGHEGLSLLVSLMPSEDDGGTSPPLRRKCSTDTVEGAPPATGVGVA